ncbi:MAG: hypothetical protein ACREB1_04535 [Sphingomicrobium sp.]
MITALFSLLLLADLPTNSVSASSTTPAAQKETPKEERKICKREDSTESRLGGKRICMTAEEWKVRKRSES